MRPDQSAFAPVVDARLALGGLVRLMLGLPRKRTPLVKQGSALPAVDRTLDTAPFAQGERASLQKPWSGRVWWARQGLNL